MYDVFIFITPKFLVYCNLKLATVSIFPYPSRSVMFNELINEVEFDSAFKSFLFTNKFVSGNTLLVISESLVFFETFQSLNPGDIQSSMNNFLKFVPIHKDFILNHVCVVDYLTHFYATDKRLPMLIKSSLEKSGWKVLSIVPVHVFQTGIGDQISADQIKNIVNNETLILKSRFNIVTQQVIIPVQQKEQVPEIEVQPKKTKTSKNQIIVLAVSLLSLLSVSTIALINSGIITPSGERKVASLQVNRRNFPTSKPVSVIQPTVTPTIAYKNKADLQILLNIQALGPDEAALVERLITEKGYKNITKNNDQALITSNEIQHSIYVSNDLKEEIKSTLSVNFPNIVFAKIPNPSPYDIIINFF